MPKLGLHWKLQSLCRNLRIHSLSTKTVCPQELSFRHLLQRFWKSQDEDLFQEAQGAGAEKFKVQGQMPQTFQKAQAFKLYKRKEEEADESVETEDTESATSKCIHSKRSLSPEEK